MNRYDEEGIGDDMYGLEGWSRALTSALFPSHLTRGNNKLLLFSDRSANLGQQKKYFYRLVQMSPSTLYFAKILHLIDLALTCRLVSLANPKLQS